jgi:hypothetical protein
MTQILQATYQNGNLILNQRLKNVVEGQVLKVMVLDSDNVALKKERFLTFVDRYAFKIPANYRFDRDELHAR